MALIATDFTVQIIVLLAGFFFLFGGGFIQKLGATGLFITGIGLAVTSQSYVSDATTPISNAFLFFPANLQVAMTVTFAISSLIAISLCFLSLRKLILLSTPESDDESDFQRKKRREAFFEELV